METLLEICVAILSGGLGVVLFRLLKPKTVSKENQAVIVKVEEKAKENENLAKQIAAELTKAQDQIQELEKEKNKDVSNKDVDDFFNNRKQ